MNAATIKLVAIDLDGTLLDPDEHISEHNRRAVARVRAGGAEVVLVTARGFHRARPFAQELGLALPVLCCGGALVADSTTGNILVHRPLPPEHALPILHFALDHALLMLVHHDGHYLAHPDTIAALERLCRPRRAGAPGQHVFAGARRPKRSGVAGRV